MNANQVQAAPAGTLSEAVEAFRVPQVPVPPGLAGTLDEVRAWFARFIGVMNELDLALLTLWVAHTYVLEECYTTPRLILDSPVPGSGKTTVLDHFQRLCYLPTQAAALSSVALLGRIFGNGPRTLLIDEVDRTLDPKNPQSPELIAILNSGYRQGSTRPVLEGRSGGKWEQVDMPTFGAVVMAGNNPRLPDDTRQRSIRVLLMPTGEVEPSDWRDIEPEARALADNIAAAMGAVRDQVEAERPPLPDGCRGRMREKWEPLLAIARLASPEWFNRAWTLTQRDIDEVAQERADALTKLPPATRVLKDLWTIWPEDEEHVSSKWLCHLLADYNPEEWGSYGEVRNPLTPQRLGRMLTQSFKLFSKKDKNDRRGYFRADVEKCYKRMYPPISKPSEPSEASEPSEGARRACPLHGAVLAKDGACSSCLAEVGASRGDV